MKSTILAKVCLIPTFILFCFHLNSCRSVRHVAKTISIESGQIPSYMESAEFGLIGVLKGKRSIDKYTRKAFAEYTGPYKLAYINDIDSIYQADTTFRYKIDYELIRTERPKINADRSDLFKTETTTSARYFIRDLERRTNTFRTSRSSFFYKELRALLKAIDRERTK